MIFIVSVSISNIDSVYASTKTITSDDNLKTVVEDSLSVSKVATINLRSGTYDVSNKTITIKGDVTINGLDSGNSKPVLDAKNKNRIFVVSKGSTLTLKNLVITNGNTTGRGGAIHSEGNLVIENCVFSKNKIHGDWTGAGGAICSRYGTLSIKSSTFTQNKAQTGGGAIYSFESNVSVLKSYFNKNQASNGGAISYSNFLFRSNNKLVVSDSHFTENRAIREEFSFSGGAIHSSYGFLNINNCIFTKNVAADGGAIYSYYNKKVSIISSTFKENSAIDGGGGAIYISSDSATINKCTFIKNVVKGDSFGGGAICAGGSSLNIFNSLFSENKATSHKSSRYQGGGAILAGTLKIDKSTFNKNTANFGGAISTGVGSSSITRSTFSKNTANNGSAIHGYGGNFKLVRHPSVLTVSKNVFSENKGKYILYKHKTNPHKLYADNNFWGKNMNLKKVKSSCYGVNISKLATSSKIRN